MPHRMLITGGFVLSGDSTVGDVANCDVLIEDGLIIDVRPGLSAADAEVIDASGTIVIPGFVDTHRHTWESAARGTMPAVTIGEYLYKTFGLLGPHYRAEDVYVGNLLGATEALNAGITTMVDWSHCNNTPEHADAGIPRCVSRASGASMRTAHQLSTGGGGSRKRNTPTTRVEFGVSTSHRTTNC